MKLLINILRIALLLCILACAAITVVAAHQRRAGETGHLALTAAIYDPVRDHTAGLDRIGFASFKDSEHGYLMRYYVAQSVLAPTLVVESMDEDVILASFAEDWRLDDFLAEHRFIVHRRFPGGVALLQRRRP